MIVAELVRLRPIDEDDPLLADDVGVAGRGCQVVGGRQWGAAGGVGARCVII